MGNYSGVRLSEIQTKPFIDWITAHASVPYTTSYALDKARIRKIKG
jgi:hypothetical protein